MPDTLTTGPAIPPLTLAASTGPNHSIVVRPGAKRVFVVFGTDAPSMAEAGVKGPANVVRLTDDEKHFSMGVNGFADTLDILFVWLRRLEQGLPITLVGQRAGANMAMAAALLLPRAELLAIDPILAAEADMLHPVWGDVATLARSFPTRRHGVVGFSAWAPQAAASLAMPDLLPSPFGAVIELPCIGNPIGYLRQRSAFATLLHGGADALRDLTAAGVVAEPGEGGSPRQYAAFSAASQLLEKGKSGRKEALRLVSAFPDWANPGWQHLRSRVLRREGDLANAVEAARQAAVAGPGVAEFCVNFGKLVIDAGMTTHGSLAGGLLQPFLKQRGIKELQSALLGGQQRTA